MELFDNFLVNTELTLAQFGFQPDPGVLEVTPSTKVFYHYTHQDRLNSIFQENSGILARKKIHVRPEFEGYCVVESFLQPTPLWLTQSPHFGSLGLELKKQAIGDIMLRAEVPHDYPDIRFYMSDFGFLMEWHHFNRKGSFPLGLCLNHEYLKKEMVRAYINSFIPLESYNGGHVAPVLNILRKGEGIAIPNRFLSAIPLLTASHT